MITKKYEMLPQEAIDIRTEVFMEEQGFQEEFDDLDDKCVHMVLFDGEVEVGCCRYYKEGSKYILGRLAVRKVYRKMHLGSVLIEAVVKELPFDSVLVAHAQCQAQAFYEKQGFVSTGIVDEDEGCPHVWMEKHI